MSANRISPPMSYMPAVKLAIDDVKSGKVASLQEAACNFNVCLDWLLLEITNRSPDKLVNSKWHIFSPTVEKEIVEWILSQEDMNDPATCEEVIEHAKELLIIGKSTWKKYRRRWFQDFKTRHPEVCIFNKKMYSRETTEYTAQCKINSFFNEIAVIVEEKKIETKSVFYLNQITYAMGKAEKPKITQAYADTRGYVKSPEGRDTCTVIEVANLMGTLILPPLFVFKGRTSGKKILSDDLPNWYYSSTPNGRMDDRLVSSWLCDIFFPFLNENNISHAILLLRNNNDYIHEVPFTSKCKEKGVIPLFLPRNCTTLLPPFHLGELGPVLPLYQTKLKGLKTFLRSPTPLKQKLFLSRYDQVRKLEMTREKLVQAWKDCGLIDFDVDKMLKLSPLMIDEIDTIPEIYNDKKWYVVATSSLQNYVQTDLESSESEIGWEDDLEENYRTGPVFKTLDQLREEWKAEKEQANPKKEEENLNQKPVAKQTPKPNSTKKQKQTPKQKQTKKITKPKTSKKMLEGISTSNIINKPRRTKSKK